MERRMKQLFSAALLSMLGLVLVSCPNPLLNKELRSQIADDVTLATAAEHRLTIEASSYGVVSPSGVQVVKNNVPVTLTVTAFPAYGVIGWTQTAGPGSVAFKQTSAGVTAAVTGGNATIAAIFVEKPKVLYSTPIGNNIARSATVTATFSKQVDFDTINLNTFKVLRNGSEQITTGKFSVSADGKTVKFDPDDPLGQFCNYVINVAADVRGVLNLADYQVGNTLITDSALLLAAEYTAAFRTNADVDNNPPDPGDFTITGTGGTVPDPYYTGSTRVRLTGITANDDSGVISAYYVKNASESAYQAFAYDYQDPSLWWTVPLSPGPQGIMMYFEDPNGNANTGTPTTKYIVVDTQAPTGTMTVNGLGPGGDYVPAGPVTLTLSATDPDIGALKGSGESANGSALTNRKLVRVANNVNGLLDAPWESYAATRSGWGLANAAEGWQTVWAQFADAVGNVSSLVSDQVYVDPTAPTGSFQLLNGLATNTESVTLAISASDGGSGLDKLQIGSSSGLQSGSAWSTGTQSGTYTGTATADFTWPADGRLNVVLAAGEGSRTVNLKVKDKVGNVSSLTQTFILDKTPPAGGAITINGGAAATNNTTVTLTLGYPADAAFMAFSNSSTLGSANWIPVSPSASWVTDSVPSPAVYAWFKDLAGNYTASAAASDSIILDTTPPTGSIGVSPNPTTGTVTISCSISGASWMQFSNNGSTWSTWESYTATKAAWSLVSGAGGSSTNGTRTVYARFSDGVGGSADSGNKQTTSATVVLDNTPPTLTITINAGAAWSTTAAVTLTLTATDALYAVNTLQMQFSNNNGTWSAWETFATTKAWDMTSATYGGTAANGTKYVYIRVKDPLGNTGSLYDGIGYDNVAPVAGTVSLNSAATYTTSASVTVTLASWSDATSGLYQMRFSNNASLWSAWEAYAPSRSGWDVSSASYGGTAANGTKYVSVQVKDSAGLVSSTASDSIIWDNVAPTGTFTIESGNPATSSWTDGYLLFSITDATSGVSQRRLSNDNITWSAWETYTAGRAAWYLLPDNGLKTVYAQFKDNAGNISSTIYDQVTLAETYSTLAGKDLWGSYSSTVSSAAAAAYMSTAALSGSDPMASSPLAIGSVIVFYTNTGRYGKMEITGFTPLRLVGLTPHYNILQFNLCVYDVDGISLYRSVTGAEVEGTYTYDLDASGAADFWWSITSSSVRQLVPQGGARFDKWK